MSNFHFPLQTHFYSGKVRDTYTIDEKWIVMIASDRISAFDVILPKTIPYKGQILTQIAALMLNQTKDICENWLLDVPAPNASVGFKCAPLKIEMVVRGNITGHAWRTYAQGKRMLCGVPLPEGLKENDFLSQPIITPTTKAMEGHDEDISKEGVISKNIISQKDYEELEKISLALFERGNELAAKRGLILADTKYEFGKIGDKIYLIDEIHTPDSSRYFYQEGFADRQEKGEKQKQLSKEFLREWLIENQFMGREGEHIPEMDDAIVQQISRRYIEVYEKLMGEPFEGKNLSEARTEKAIIRCLASLS